jgi:hypothetical protein
MKNRWNRFTVQWIESTEAGPRVHGLSLNESRQFLDLWPRFKTRRSISRSNLGRQLTRGRRQALLLPRVARPRQSSGGTKIGGSGELKR